MTEWKVYGVCPGCGYKEIPYHGNMWFLEKELCVCPVCGTWVKEWNRKVGRKVIIKKGEEGYGDERYRWEWKEYVDPKKSNDRFMNIMFWFFILLYAVGVLLAGVCIWYT